VVAIGLIWSVAAMSKWVPVQSAEMSSGADIRHVTRLRAIEKNGPRTAMRKSATSSALLAPDSSIRLRDPRGDHLSALANGTYRCLSTRCPVQ
jgi:hypothetical protein